MLATALLTATLAAPIPKAKPTELYFPTVEGTKRVMEVTTTGSQTGERTETVSKVEEKDGKYTVSIVLGEVSNQSKPVVYEVSDKGVSQTPPDGGDLVPVLKLGKAGESWATEQPARGGGQKTTYTTGKEEEVEVPAGKYKAIPVTIDAPFGDRTYRTVVWYAPGVGVVKSTVEISGITRTEVLKSFTSGKDAKK